MSEAFEGAPTYDRAVELLAEQRAEEAEALIRDVLLRVQHPEIHASLALALLMQGKYRDGFREFEGRSSRRKLVKRMTIPEWDGQIAGRGVIVWGEQGLGDEVQGARFVPLIRELGASHITFACRRENVRAFQQVGADAVVDRDTPTIEVPKAACWIALWSLPHRLGLRADDISGAPYLRAQPTRRGGIGLVERGNPLNPNDAERSLPAGLLRAAVPQGELLSPAGDTMDSLHQLAGLDLLITVDTSWAHMAGALGVPCWVLLPFRRLDWRWQRGRTDSPWYDSVRLFRQPEPGDWTSVLNAVQSALSTRLP